MAAWYDKISGTVCAELSSLCDYILRAGDLVARGNVGIVGRHLFSHARDRVLPTGDGVYRYIANGITVFCEPDAVTLHGTCAEIQVLRSVSYSLASVRGAELEAGSTYALCVAALVMEQKNLVTADIRLIYSKEGSATSRVFACQADRETAFDTLTQLLTRFAPYAALAAEHEKMLAEELRAMRFPYSNVREGQKEFMQSVLRAIKSHTRLVAEAPTGIGKTMAALYPAVKALGEGYADKIFCLTSKGTNANSEESAVLRLMASVPHLRAVTILSRDSTYRTSYCAGRQEGGKCRLWDCPIGGGHNARMNGAILELLSENGYYTRDRIYKIAEKHALCPYELSLELSEWCDVILCDYNYLFDRGVYLRRYFESPDARYVFLIDEAHNLPDRASAMYSARLTSSAFAEAMSRTADSPELQSAIPPILDLFSSLRELSLEEKRIEQGNIEWGFALLETPPHEIENKLKEFIKAANAYFDTGALDAALSELSYEARRFLLSLSYYGKRFAMYAETRGEETACRILCLDPSERLDEAMSAGISSILFSATISPLDYYADLLGCAKAKTLKLDSVYERDNLCILGFDGVSTRYEDRDRRGYVALVNIIRTVIAGKKGKYIVYFPSYQYMSEVYWVFAKKYPEIATVVQEKGMTAGARNRFLAQFSDKSKEALLGFCVLGGSFSEGVDLQGESLIGAIVVGVGFPSVSSELNLAKEYFDRTRESGMEYAYIYPGMNKVMQAVGRVIRSERDRGVAVIIDDRFSRPPYTTLLPGHWQGIRYTSNLKSLLSVLRDFWKNGQEK
ncbi:MAG: ATP-dependent DNA helicase [Clostridia bacterium]|nr:ATP-dependent DNA helicase [Clostridia bacterium]